MQRRKATGVKRSKNSRPTGREKESPAKFPRRLILLEDNPDDALLIRKVLAKQWPDCEVITVNDEPKFKSALQRSDIDLILSDYSIPGFDGLDALMAARAQRP